MARVVVEESVRRRLVLLMALNVILGCKDGLEGRRSLIWWPKEGVGETNRSNRAPKAVDMAMGDPLGVQTVVQGSVRAKRSSRETMSALSEVGSVGQDEISVVRVAEFRNGVCPRGTAMLHSVLYNETMKMTKFCGTLAQICDATQATSNPIISITHYISHHQKSTTPSAPASRDLATIFVFHPHDDKITDHRL